jgi:putative ATP-dependent endonuclease of the OLD family
MHLSQIEFAGFRNLDETVSLAHPLAVLVGANNVGKSNVIDALRMTLMPLTGWPLRPRRDDFAHGGTGEPIVTEMTVTARFEGLTLQQRGRMVTALDGARDRAALHLHCALPAVGQPRGRYLGGDAKTPDIEEWARSAVTYTYLPPLRDAEEDMRPGRNNRLVELIAALTGDGPDLQRILDIATKANSDLSNVPSLIESRTRIQERLNSLSGTGNAQRANLLFTEPLFERVLSTLGVRVGDDLPLAMSQNGLGMNNILYMAVLLAGLTYDHDSDLHLLLVEEPEAHLHPQMQDLLMRFLQKEVENRDDVQVVVTTHSPNFTSSARVERITSLSRLPSGVTSRAIEQLGVQNDELDYLARFLDVTKASLLFARAVMLVEGIAEQLVLPLLAAELDPPRSLAESSVAVVNVGGLAFGPFAALYDDGRLPNRCAIVSDSDPPAAKDQTPDELAKEMPRESADASQDQEALARDEPGLAELAGQPESEADPVLSATAQKLKSSENERRQVFLSAKTFEYDLVLAGNWEWAIAALRMVKPRVAKWLEENDALDNPEKKAAALLEAVDGVKGRFAQALTRTLESVKTAGHSISVPSYIREAIEWVCEAGEPTGTVMAPDGADGAQAPVASASDSGDGSQTETT